MSDDQLNAPYEEPALSLADAAQVASLDAVQARLVADAQSWAPQLGELSALAARAERAGARTRRTLALKLAGTLRVGQVTAERWVAEAELVPVSATSGEAAGSDPGRRFLTVGSARRHQEGSAGSRPPTRRSRHPEARIA